MLREKIEVWVIDPSAPRRSLMTNALGEMGYAALPIDPAERLPDALSRDVVAMVSDDTDVVDRVLDWSAKRPVSCVVYSDSLKAKRAAELVRRGVRELMDWPCQRHEIADAVSVAEAALAIPGENARHEEIARQRIEALTRREKEVLGAVMLGMTSRQIAEALDLSHRTVEVHRINCYRRLGVKSTADAVKLGKASGCFKFAVEI